MIRKVVHFSVASKRDSLVQKPEPTRTRLLLHEIR